ncbi:hypothetical protein EVAR_88631_1 [Eumeta japonica]|uniref:Uncharacterized protein n=1 Tax=Eumeta variegata TaxID=151549 RepID=A0A4C1X208_EUMVA|nr:hypothetical protein EVAR_88631_1 [Eumeta japonica]
MGPEAYEPAVTKDCVCSNQLQDFESRAAKILTYTLFGPVTQVVTGWANVTTAALFTRAMCLMNTHIVSALYHATTEVYPNAIFLSLGVDLDLARWPSGGPDSSADPDPGDPGPRIC